ncbi:MAG: AMP-binding protein [Candidatus Omnitrophica bacterium]|nr:AMP-binding protein [Candidatus Omnitrophota bacterium]
MNDLIIPGRFEAIVGKFPDGVALQIKKDNCWIKFTYLYLRQQAVKVANFLLSIGLKRQDPVAIVLENRPEWPTIYLGIMYAGMICVPIDTQASFLEIKNFLLDSSTKILFTSQDLFNKKISPEIQEILSKIVVLDATDSVDKKCFAFKKIEDSPYEDKNLPSLQAEDIALLIYTSGTTGIPKGVLLTHKNIVSNFLSIQKLNLVSNKDNFLCLLPLHHTYPFMVTLIVPLFSAAKITFCPSGFRPEQLAEIIKEAGITILVGVPQLFSLLYTAIFEKLKHTPRFIYLLLLPFIRFKVQRHFGRTLRLMVSGGARLSPKIALGLRRLGFCIIEGYGLTETSPVVTLNPPKKIKLGSVGRPIPDVEIKISCPDGKGIGEVLVRGANVMAGYFKQPDLTAAVIKDNWFYSGDLGYLDKEGYLFLTGRTKEVIILSSGKTIFPEELEEYYQRSPYIKEICILGKEELAFGHEVESLYAVVVPDLDYFCKNHLTDIEGKIRWELENLSQPLPAYKHIRGFVLSKEELPRTALKKIKRYRVKERFLAHPQTKVAAEEIILKDDDLKELNPEIAQKIICYLGKQLNKVIYLDSHLEIDLGIDSLMRVELGLGLERLFGLRVPDEMLYTVSTVREVILKISELMKDKDKIRMLMTEREKTWSQILKVPPEPNARKKIKLKPGVLDWLVTSIIKVIVVFIFRLCWRLKVKGRKNLPKRGPLLICPNHASYLDGFIVFCGLPLKLAINTYFLGYRAIFEHSLLRWAIRIARLIPIDPTTYLMETLQIVAYLLSWGKAVCVFPEGRRSIDDKIGEFKKGIGILIKELRELNFAVVPVYIRGSHYAWPRTRLLPRFCRLEIIFGQPKERGFFLESGREKEIKDDYTAIAQGLREEVLKLR